MTASMAKTGTPLFQIYEDGDGKLQAEINIRPSEEALHALKTAFVKLSDWRWRQENGVSDPPWPVFLTPNARQTGDEA